MSWFIKKLDALRADALTYIKTQIKQRGKIDVEIPFYGDVALISIHIEDNNFLVSGIIPDKNIYLDALGPETICQIGDIINEKIISNDEAGV